MGPLLVVTGLAAALIGAWRGYEAARGAIGPFVHEGDQTRALIQSARPAWARSRVRLFVRRVGESVAWLLVASYGLFLLSVGASTP